MKLYKGRDTDYNLRALCDGGSAILENVSRSFLSHIYRVCTVCTGSVVNDRRIPVRRAFGAASNAQRFLCTGNHSGIFLFAGTGDSHQDRRSGCHFYRHAVPGAFIKGGET